MWSLGFFIVFFWTIGYCRSQVELEGPYCGSIRCPKFFYCDGHTSVCESCSKICAPNHNFDQESCLQKCQVYFFDQRYYEKTGDNSNTMSLIDALQIKSNIVIAILVVILLSAILFLIVKQQKLKLSNLRQIFKKKENKRNGTTNNSVPNIESPSSIIQTESPSTATTGITSRIPAEDSINYAYDNPAMSNSPKTISSVTPS